MGLLKRTLGVLNRVGGEVYSPEILIDKRWKAGDEVMEGGTQLAGRLAGIERKLEDGTDVQLLALEVEGRAGRAGVRLSAPHRHRLRLGMPLVLRVQEEHAVLDWPALCATWGLEEKVIAQRLLKKPPEDGVRDRAVDMLDARRLKKWTPARGTVVQIDRKTALGMPTLNFEIALEVEGGHTVADQHVPFYASWLAAPGRQLPIAVDPDRPGRAKVDWETAANEAATEHGALDDPPPEGSVAALLDVPADATPVAQTDAAPPADPAVAPIEGVDLETWAAITAGIARARVAPADYDAHAVRHGAPPGRWSAIDAQWQSRMMSDWRVGAKMGEAVEAAKKRR